MSCRIALLTLLIAASAAGEPRCTPDETPRRCLRRLIATRAYETARAQLGATTTGPSTPASPARSAVKDFLSAVSAHLDGSTLEDSGTALTFDYNLPATLFGASRQFNLQATLTDPALSAVAAAEIPNDPVTTALLKDALARGDDVAVGLSFNLVSRRFGRSIVPHEDLFESMLLGLVEEAGSATAAIPATAFDTPFVEIVPDAAARIAAVTEFETASMAAMPAVAERLTQDLKRLASNQPQLFATALYHHREPAIGPRERGVRVTWEIGTDNLNAFRRGEGRDCQAQGTCLAAFHAYAARTAAAHRTGRLSLAVEYRLTEAHDPGLVSPPVTVEAAHRFTYSLTYGREVTSWMSGRQGRIDFTLNYDGENMKQDLSVGGFGGVKRVGSTAIEWERQILPPSSTRYSAAAMVTQPVAGDRLSFIGTVIFRDRELWLPGTARSSPVSPPFPTGNGHTEPFRQNERGFEVRAGFRYQVPSFLLPSRPSGKQCCC